MAAQTVLQRCQQPDFLLSLRKKSARVDSVAASIEDSIEQHLGSSGNAVGPLSSTARSRSALISAPPTPPQRVPREGLSNESQPALENAQLRRASAPVQTKAVPSPSNGPAAVQRAPHETGPTSMAGTAAEKGKPDAQPAVLSHHSRLFALLDGEHVGMPRDPAVERGRISEGGVPVAVMPTSGLASAPTSAATSAGAVDALSAHVVRMPNGKHRTFVAGSPAFLRHWHSGMIQRDVSGELYFVRNEA